MSSSNLIKAHLPCPMCDSSDAYAIYDDGHGYCHSCEGWNNHSNDTNIKVKEQKNMTLSKGKYLAIPDRNISQDTALFYGVSSDENKHIYPYSDQSGQWVSNKIRRLPKQFSFEGEAKGLQLFGQVKFNRGGKYVTITEGELDALSAYELFGSKFPVVSVRSSSSAYKDCKENFEWLDSFQHIVLAFDADKAGQEASKQIADLFGFKVKTMKMDKQLKDASNYLKNKKFKDFSQHWWSAEEHRPDGVVSGKDMWEIISVKEDIETTPFPWDSLNNLVYGMRMGELITLTAGSGMGKTQVLREIEHHLLSTTKHNIGCIFLEETLRASGIGLVSIEANLPLHLPDVEIDDKEFKVCSDNTLGTNRVHYYDPSKGFNNIDNLLAKIKYFAKAIDCKFILFDHISLVVSDQSQGDERKALDEIATKLSNLTKALGICIIMVSHAKRQTTKAHEEGGITSLSDLRGTAAIGQLSSTVIGLERNGQAEDLLERNTTTVRVLKCRFTGSTGPSSLLRYNRATGRMTELTFDPDMEENDEGSS